MAHSICGRGLLRTIGLQLLQGIGGVWVYQAVHCACELHVDSQAAERAAVGRMHQAAMVVLVATNSEGGCESVRAVGVAVAAHPHHPVAVMDNVAGEANLVYRLCARSRVKSEE